MHDPLTLSDAALLQRRDIAAIGPAAAENPALDLTASALGLALQISFVTPQELSVPSRDDRRRPPDTVAVEAILCTPTRPAHLLEEATAHRLPVAQR